MNIKKKFSQTVELSIATTFVATLLLSACGGGGGGGGTSNSTSSSITSTTIVASPSLGQFVSGAKVIMRDKNGKQVGSGTIGADGTASINVNDNAEGPFVLEAGFENDSYFDEKEGKQVTITSVGSGPVLHAMLPKLSDAASGIGITPLTEFAASGLLDSFGMPKVGITPASAVQANQEVSNIFGIHPLKPPKLVDSVEKIKKLGTAEDDQYAAKLTTLAYMRADDNDRAHNIVKRLNNNLQTADYKVVASTILNDMKKVLDNNLITDLPTESKDLLKTTVNLAIQSGCSNQPCSTSPMTINSARVSGPYAFDVLPKTQVVMHLKKSEFVATNAGTGSSVSLGVTADERVGVFWNIPGKNVGAPVLSNAGAIVDKNGALLAVRNNFATFAPVFSESGIIAAAGIFSYDQFNVKSSIALQNTSDDWFLASREYINHSSGYGGEVKSVKLSPNGTVSWLVSKEKMGVDSGTGLPRIIGSTIYLASLDNAANRLPDVMVDDFNFAPGKSFLPAQPSRSSAENNEQLVVWEGLDELSNPSLRGMIIDTKFGVKSPAFTVRTIPNGVTAIAGLSVAYNPSGYGAVVWAECATTVSTPQTQKCGVHGVRIARSASSLDIGAPVTFDEDGANTLANIDSSGRAVAVWTSKKMSSSGSNLYKYETSVSDSNGNWQPKQTLFPAIAGDSVFINEENGTSSAGHIVVTTRTEANGGFGDLYSARYVRKYVPGTGWLPVQQVFSSGYSLAVKASVGPTGLGAIAYITTFYCRLGDTSCDLDSLYVMTSTF